MFIKVAVVGAAAADLTECRWRRLEAVFDLLQSVLGAARSYFFWLPLQCISDELFCFSMARPFVL